MSCLLEPGYAIADNKPFYKRDKNFDPQKEGPRCEPKSYW